MSIIGLLRFFLSKIDFDSSFFVREEFLDFTIPTRYVLSIANKNNLRDKNDETILECFSTLERHVLLNMNEDNLNVVLGEYIFRENFIPRSLVFSRENVSEHEDFFKLLTVKFTSRFRSQEIKKLFRALCNMAIAHRNLTDSESGFNFDTQVVQEPTKYLPREIASHIIGFAGVTSFGQVPYIDIRALRYSSPTPAVARSTVYPEPDEGTDRQDYREEGEV